MINLTKFEEKTRNRIATNGEGENKQSQKENVQHKKKEFTTKSRRLNENYCFKKDS